MRVWNEGFGMSCLNEGFGMWVGYKCEVWIEWVQNRVEWSFAANIGNRPFLQW